MLGLILIYFVGRNYFELAHEHNRPAWLFAILGVLTFFFGQFFLGTIVATLIVSSTGAISDGTYLLVSVISIACGAAAIWFMYKRLESFWKANPKPSKSGRDLIDNF